MPYVWDFPCRPGCRCESSDAMHVQAPRCRCGMYYLGDACPFCETRSFASLSARTKEPTRVSLRADADARLDRARESARASTAKQLAAAGIAVPADAVVTTKRGTVRRASAMRSSTGCSADAAATGPQCVENVRRGAKLVQCSRRAKIGQWCRIHARMRPAHESWTEPPRALNEEPNVDPVLGF